jgi:Bacteriophage HK97-gp10, putative tail-component
VADEISVEVHGYPELLRGSEELFEKIEEEANDRFEDVADKAASAARARVPRLSGALAASIGVERRGESVLVGMGDSDTPYAGWIEFGGLREGRGGGVAERPYIPRGRYLYPAAFNAEPMLISTASDVADDEIRRFRWESP